MTERIVIEAMPSMHRVHIAAYSRLITDSIRVQNFREHRDDPDSVRQWTRNALFALVHADYACTAHDQNGKTTGVAAMDLGNSHARLVVLYVHPAQGRKGIGATLLSQIIGVTKTHSFKELHVFSSMLALPFYRRCGFEHNGEPQRGAGITWDFPMLLKTPPK